MVNEMWHAVDTIDPEEEPDLDGDPNFSTASSPAKAARAAGTNNEKGYLTGKKRKDSTRAHPLEQGLMDALIDLTKSNKESSDKISEAMDRKALMQFRASFGTAPGSRAMFEEELENLEGIMMRRKGKSLGLSRLVSSMLLG